MGKPRLTTFGRYDMDRICAVVVCSRLADNDDQASLRFAQAVDLLRSCGMEFHAAVPEEQETRRPWWRPNRKDAHQ